MELNIYTIYDKVAAVFNKPFIEINNASAIRAFENSIKDSPNVIDYNLYHIGTYNDNNGEIDPICPETIRIGFDIAATAPIKQPNVSSITPEMQKQDLKHESCS